MSVKNDIDGKESSKRKIGMKFSNWSLYIISGHYVISTIYSIFVLKVAPHFPREEWMALLITGASLLGVSLAERFGPKK